MHCRSWPGVFIRVYEVFRMNADSRKEPCIVLLYGVGESAPSVDGLHDSRQSKLGSSVHLSSSVVSRDIVNMPRYLNYLRDEKLLHKHSPAWRTYKLCDG